MENLALNQKLRDFCHHLSKNDSSGEKDSLLCALKLYSDLSPSDMYANMILAQSALFGGKIEMVRRSVDGIMPDDDDFQKSQYLAGAMRDSIIQTMENLPKDTVLARIFKTTTLFEDNTEHIWECLFAAATYYKQEMMSPLNDPRNFTRQVLMSEFSSAERDLYGKFDPTPISEADDDAEIPAPPFDPPKFIH